LNGEVFERHSEFPEKPPHGRDAEVWIVKVKLFVQDKSPFRRWGRFLAALEEEVNIWLAAHPEIKIIHIAQSSNGGSFDTSKVFLSVWYEEGAESAATLDRAGSTAFRSR
jgi:hypothetical protein